MAATVQQVRDIYRSGLSDAEIQASLDVAQKVIDQHLSSVTDQSLLDEIHRFLGAHFAVLNEERGELASQEAGAVREEYERPRKNLGLAETRYGRMAIVLDPTGTLATVGKQSSFIKAFGGEQWP